MLSGFEPARREEECSGFGRGVAAMPTQTKIQPEKTRPLLLGSRPGSAGGIQTRAGSSQAPDRAVPPPAGSRVSFRGCLVAHACTHLVLYIL